MTDLTQGSIARHMLLMAAPFAANALAQMSYQLITLYFVVQLGPEATAGVNIAGNISVAVSALTYVLGAGTATLVAHQAGHRSRRGVALAMNQSLALSVGCGVMTALLIACSARLYMESIAADAATIAAGMTFTAWMLPGFALMFPWAVLGASLRGAGIVRPTVVTNAITVGVNVIAAPVLIAGWGTGMPLGVTGAALATSFSVLVGVIALVVYAQRAGSRARFTVRLMRPSMKQWGRILYVGLPAGGEFALLFLSSAVVYHVIRDFGAPAQAGFGIGLRILQTALLPGMAIAFAVGPIAGQNFGAMSTDRVRQTLRTAAVMATVAMTAIMILVQVGAETLVAQFESDLVAAAAAVLFIQIRSWSLVPQGLVYTCTNMFQAVGNTIPSLLSSAARFVAFALSALWLSTQPRFRMEHVWYAWVGSVLVQAVLSWVLLRVELRKRLPGI